MMGGNRHVVNAKWSWISSLSGQLSLWHKKKYNILYLHISTSSNIHELMTSTMFWLEFKSPLLLKSLSTENPWLMYAKHISWKLNFAVNYVSCFEYWKPLSWPGTHLYKPLHPSTHSSLLLSIENTFRINLNGLKSSTEFFFYFFNHVCKCVCVCVRVCAI